MKTKILINGLLTALLLTATACSVDDDNTVQSDIYDVNGRADIRGTYETAWQIHDENPMLSSATEGDPVTITIADKMEFSSLPCRSIAERFLGYSQKDANWTTEGAPYTLEPTLNGYSSSSLYYTLAGKPYEFAVGTGDTRQTIRINVTDAELVYGVQTGVFGIVMKLTFANSSEFSDVKATEMVVGLALQAGKYQ